MKNYNITSPDNALQENIFGKSLFHLVLVSFFFCFMCDSKIYAQQRITYRHVENYDSLAGWNSTTPQMGYQKTLDKYKDSRLIERLMGFALKKESGFHVGEKIEYKYNSKGQVVEIKYQYPSIYLADSFLGGRTETFEYHESGKLSETQVLVYDRGKQIYFPQNKTQYLYNANQQLIEIIYFAWDNPGQKLFESERNQYFYNSAGKLVYQTEGNFRTDFSYDSSGNISDLVTRYYKSHKKYNAQKQLILQLDSSYYAPKNKYIFHGFLENIYNEQGQLIQETRHSESPDDGSDVPFYINDRRTIYEYDDSDSLTRKTYQVGQRIFSPNKPDPELKWINEGRENYSYEILPENTDSGFPDMFLYPNPTSGKILLTNLIEQGCAVKVDIIDLKGQIVATFNKKVTGYEQYHPQCRWDLDLSSLTDGIYFVRIVNRDGQYFAKKVLLQK